MPLFPVRFVKYDILTESRVAVNMPLLTSWHNPTESRVSSPSLEMEELPAAQKPATMFLSRYVEPSDILGILL